MESTSTLRDRLGFKDSGRWKQFCARRLQLIHNLSLNLRKASEQEEQVRALASELCAEYGFSAQAKPDFEKLLIAGIQSVRRNQKRSGRQFAMVPVLNVVGCRTENLHLDDRKIASSEFHSNNVPLPSATGVPHTQQQRDYTKTDTNDFSAPAADSPLTQSLAARIGVLRDLITSSGSRVALNSNTLIRLNAQSILSIAVSTAVMHAKLPEAGALSLLNTVNSGLLVNALCDVVDPKITVTKFLDCLGTLAASLVHGPLLLGALQALFVCLAQISEATVPRMISILDQCSLRDRGSSQPPQMNQPSQPVSPQPSFPQSQMSSSTSLNSQDISRGQGQEEAPQIHQGHQFPQIPQVPSVGHVSPVPSIPSTSPVPQMVQVQNTSVQTPHIPQIPHVPQVPQVTQVPQVLQLSQLPNQGVHIPPISISPTPLANRSSSQPQIHSQPLSHSAPLTPLHPNPQHTPESHSQPHSQSATPALKTESFERPIFSLTEPQVISVAGPDRQVTLRFNDKSLKLTYSPLKATPPTIGEIIDNARHSFSIPLSTVVRIKDMRTSKIIESNSELIDSFCMPEVQLELIVPPPMLIDSLKLPKRSNIKFTPLAPIMFNEKNVSN